MQKRPPVVTQQAAFFHDYGAWGEKMAKKPYCLLIVGLVQVKIKHLATIFHKLNFGEPGRGRGLYRLVNTPGKHAWERLILHRISSLGRAPCH